MARYKTNNNDELQYNHKLLLLTPLLLIAIFCYIFVMAHSKQTEHLRTSQPAQSTQQPQKATSQSSIKRLDRVEQPQPASSSSNSQPPAQFPTSSKQSAASPTPSGTETPKQSHTPVSNRLSEVTKPVNKVVNSLVP